MLWGDKPVIRIQLLGRAQDEMLNLRFIHFLLLHFLSASDISGTVSETTRGIEMNKPQSLLSKKLNDIAGGDYHLSEATDR